VAKREAANPDVERPRGNSRIKWWDKNKMDLEDLWMELWTGFTWLGIENCSGLL
jgi:hypothetical protein